MKIAALFTVVLLAVVISAVTADYTSVYHWHNRFSDFLKDIPGLHSGGRKIRRDVYLNKWRLRHSLVDFGNKFYEWGPRRFGGRSLSYSDGGLGRTRVRGWKTYQGRSRCTQEEADSLGRWYMRYNTYNLLFNNCHHYAEWLINKLINNRCREYTLS